MQHALETVFAIAIAVTSAFDLHALEVGPDFWSPVPSSPSTTMPTQIKDNYWHSQFVRVNKEVAAAKDVHVVFFGDSITKRWSLLKAEGKTVWNTQLAKYNPINMGNSGDITPVMLYRVNHGNLDFPKGQAPRVAVLLCGTNNYGVTQSDGGKVKWDLGLDTPPHEVADGIRAIAQAFRTKLPGTRVIVLGILPVKQQPKWAKCQETNRVLAGYHYPKDEVVFINLADRFTNPDGSQKSERFTDGTHLTAEGYQALADALQPEIDRLIALGPIKSDE